MFCLYYFTNVAQILQFCKLGTLSFLVVEGVRMVNVKEQLVWSLVLVQGDSYVVKVSV